MIWQCGNDQVIVKIKYLKLKQTYLPIFLFVLLSVIWLFNESLINPPTANIRSTSKDTIINFKLPLYKDTTLCSGYFSNYAQILNQLVNSKRIDSLLKSPLPTYYALTEEDKKDYILSINQKAIKAPTDTIIFGIKYSVTYLPVRFTNYSRDTLKYIDMDCTWLDCYFTNNNRVKFEQQICFKNEPYIYEIAPQHSLSINIPIVLNDNGSSLNQKFRIGISLQKYIDNSQLLNFDAFNYFLRSETSNIIWSNEVELRFN